MLNKIDNILTNIGHLETHECEKVDIVNELEEVKETLKALYEELYGVSLDTLISMGELSKKSYAETLIKKYFN